MRRKRRDIGNDTPAIDRTEGIESQPERTDLDSEGFLTGEPDPEPAAGSGSERINGIVVEQPSAGIGDDNGSDGGSRVPKRRGRKPGSKNKVVKTQSTYAVDRLETLLLGAHSIAATFLKNETLELDKDEAAKLASAIKELSDVYGTLPVVSPKVMAWINLAMAGGAVYGPRIAAARIQKMSKPKPAPVVMQVRNAAPQPQPQPKTEELPKTETIDFSKVCPSQLDNSSPEYGEITQNY